MKRKIIWILPVLCLGLVYYNHQYHCYGYPFRTMPSGIFYKAIGKKGSGKKVQDGQWVDFSLTIKSIHKQGTKDSKRKAKETILVDQAECLCRFDKSLQVTHKLMAEMIAMVQEKQRMVFKYTPESYLQAKDPKNLEQFLKQNHLNKEDQLFFDIRLDKIMTHQEYSQMVAERHMAQLAKDKQLITDYLVANHIQASSTDSGLFYIIDQPTQGAPVIKGKKVKVHYTGRLLDGTIFDTNIQDVAQENDLYHPKRSYEPFEVEVGKGQVILGWEEGLLLLKQGEKARFFIPSALAYGDRAMGALIPENANLVFEVEVLDIL